MSNYSAGRTFEWKVRDALIAAGFWVIRAAGSKGAADLVAIKAVQTDSLNNPNGGAAIPLGVHQILLVQAKNDNYFPTREWNALFDLSVQLCAIPVLAKKEARGAPIEFWRLTAPKEGRGHLPSEKLNLLR